MSQLSFVSRSAFKTSLRTVIFMTGILLVGSATADQNDPRLEELFAQLHKATSTTEAAPLEATIWGIWTEHKNPACSSLMERGVLQMNSGDLTGALATYTQLIELAPDFAEAWNKRATLYFLMGDYPKSELDIQKTLSLEPFHFGALSGRGLVKMGMKDYEGARNALHGALEVNPNMPSVKANIAELDAFLRKRSI
ncbi:MAG: tetratricopeptide repeat protein [Pseudomonadota bacterium]